MTQDEMAKVMDRVFEACRELRAKAQREYAHDPNNAFRNFEALGKELGLPREHVLWVYAKKHHDGIVAYLNGYKSQREDVRGRIKDFIVYLCLLHGMVDENECPPTVELSSASEARASLGSAFKMEER